MFDSFLFGNQFDYPHAFTEEESSIQAEVEWDKFGLVKPLLFDAEILKWLAIVENYAALKLSEAPIYLAKVCQLSLKIGVFDLSEGRRPYQNKPFSI